MNITKNDIGLLFAMAVTVVGMSFVFPALGMGGDRVTDSEMPDFNITANAFDFAGEFPDSPGTPSEGELTWQEDLSGNSDNSVEIDSDDGDAISLFNDGTASNPNASVTVSTYVDSTTGFATDEYHLTSVNETATHNNNSYEIFLKLESLENVGDSDMTMVVSYDIQDQPSDTSWISRIPVIGGLTSGGAQLAQYLGWGFSIIFWGVGTIISIIVNMLNVLVQGIAFFISMFHWIGTTYSGIVASAPGWASVVAVFPSLVLALEFAKVVFVAVDTVWIG